jgi:predicted nucleic acid-binding protein
MGQFIWHTAPKRLYRELRPPRERPNLCVGRQESRPDQILRRYKEEIDRPGIPGSGEKGLAELITYFFDSYAFYEVFAGNKNYRPYSKGIAIITTKLSLMEFHYGLLVEHGKEFADMLYDGNSQFCVDIDDDTIKEANQMGLSMKGRKLSYVDCIVYVMAKRRGIPFLTSDMQFMDLENVEYVK